MSYQLPVKCTFIVTVLAVTLVSGRPATSDSIYFPTDDHVEHSLPVFEQSAASNTGSQTVVGKDGSVQQQNFGSSMSSNVASDLSSGQLSATNTQQSSLQSGDKFQSANSAQGQSAAFDREKQALANANTNTNVVRDGANVREQTAGGAASSLKTTQGSQASQAQTNSESFKEPGKEGNRTTGSAQSQNIGMDGTGSASNANTGSEKIVLADGTVITKSFGSSSSFQVSGNTKASSMAQTFSQSFGG
uniref:Secreted protein n=1 Tax=Anopheles epiroticus TaxID=199890 RepID=A0A182PJN1_9DIPT